MEILEYDEPDGHYNQNEDALPVAEENDERKKNEENRKKCGSECVCKMKQAVTLITEEMKKVDEIVSVLDTEGTCPYTPSPNDKKEFAKSVQKNASVCHLIIEELKNQRAEINEMLRWYNALKDDFAELDFVLNQQREKIQNVEVILENLEETVKTVKNDMDKRHEIFFDEMKTRKARTDRREQILKTFIEWISSLDAKRNEEKRQADAHLENVISERNEDRMMLTLAVKQLQVARKIEMLTTDMEGKAGLHNDIITQQQPSTSRRATFCTCALSISKGYTNPINNRRGCKCLIKNCTKNENPVFNVGIMRCAGGTELCGTAQQIAAPSKYKEMH